MIFQNSFFSIEGQKERLSNVGATLLSAVGLKEGGVQSNTGLKPVDTVLSAVASHPFVTAGVVAGGLTVAGKTAPTAFTNIAKPTLNYIGPKIAAKPLTSSVIALGGVTALRSETGRQAAIDLPKNLNEASKDAAALIDNPSLAGVGNYVKNHPVLAATLAGAGLIVAGSVAKGAAPAIATYLNTQAINEQTGAIKTATEKMITEKPLGATSGPTSTPSTAGTAALAAPVTDSSVKTPIIPASKGSVRGVKRRKKAKEQPRMTQNVRVNVIDDRDVSDRKVYKSRNQRS